MIFEATCWAPSCDALTTSAHPVLGGEAINSQWPYCSDECKAGGEVRAALDVRVECAFCGKPSAHVYIDNDVAVVPRDRLIRPYCSQECLEKARP